MGRDTQTDRACHPSRKLPDRLQSVHGPMRCGAERAVSLMLYSQTDVRMYGVQSVCARNLHDACNKMQTRFPFPTQISPPPPKQCSVLRSR